VITNKVYQDYLDAHEGVDEDLNQCWHCSGPIEKNKEDYYKIVYSRQNEVLNYNKLGLMPKHYYVYFHTTCFIEVAGDKYAFKINNPKLEEKRDSV
jgi:hypothetical protein